MKEFMPMSGREFPRFSAIKTFFRLPIAEVSEEFDLALVGIPFDGAVSYRPGARFAPTQVREASSLGRGYHWSRGYNVFEKIKVADVGDCQTVPIDQIQTYQKIENFFDKLALNNKRAISIGGDHSITLPLLRAAHRKAKSKLSLIHFDAHLDTYPPAWNCEYHHGAFVRHAILEGLIDPEKSVHIGIRGPLAASEDLEFVKQHKMNVITVDDIRSKNLNDFLKSMPQFNELPSYLSFDIDCLDPAYAPGTGTPVVGGLTTYESQQILRNLKIKKLIGADIVEISPPYDHAQITSLAGVDTLFELICLMSQSIICK